MLITSRPYLNRDMRDAYRMVYRSNAQTQDAMRIQSEYRRALVREIVKRKEQA